MSTFDNLLHSRGFSEEEFQTAQRQTFKFDNERWESLEKEIQEEVEAETAKWAQTKTQLPTPSRFAFEDDADGDNSRLQKLDRFDSDDSDDEYSNTQETDTKHALVDLERIKVEAKKRLEEAKLNANQSFEKQKKAIHVYAHPASVAFDEQKLLTALGRSSISNEDEENVEPFQDDSV